MVTTNIPSVVALQAQIAEIRIQRDMAQQAAVSYAGRIAELEKQVREMAINLPMQTHIDGLPIPG
jgi:hypothetical protein